MPSGYIQLISVGSEYMYLNKNPDISFFKGTFERFSNFSIENKEIAHSDLICNTLINDYPISLFGDLASPDYIKFKFNVNYVELFNIYQSLENTQKICISNYYNSFSTLYSTFSKNTVTDISIVKFIFRDLKNSILMSTWMPLTTRTNILNIIHTNSNIVIETNDMFCNINPFYNFYSWICYDENIYSFYNTVSILLSQINYSTFRYIRIDVGNNSFKFSFSSSLYTLYNTLVTLCIDNNPFLTKISQYDIYFKFVDNENILDLILETFIYSTLSNVYLKLNMDFDTKSIVIDSINVKSYIQKLLLNNKLFVFYIDTNIHLEIETEKNIDINDFNQSLIQDETNLLNMENIGNTKLIPVKKLINTLIDLITYSTPSQNKLKTFINLTNSCLSNLSIDAVSIDFRKAHNISNFINISVYSLLQNIFLKNTNIKSIIYQSVVVKNFDQMIVPFINKKLSSNNPTYFLLFKTFIDTFNINSFSSLTSINDILNNCLSLCSLSTFDNVDIVNTDNMNYVFNNNVFDKSIEKNISGQSKSIYTNVNPFLSYMIYITQIISLDNDHSLINSGPIDFRGPSLINSGPIDFRGPSLINSGPIDFRGPIFNLSDFILNDKTITCTVLKKDYENLIKNMVSTNYINDFKQYNTNIMSKAEFCENSYNYYNDMFLSPIVSKYYEKIIELLSENNLSNIFSCNKIIYTDLIFDNSCSPYINSDSDSDNDNDNDNIYILKSPIYRMYYYYVFLTNGFCVNHVKVSKSTESHDMVVLKNILFDILMFYKDGESSSIYNISPFLNPQTLVINNFIIKPVSIPTGQIYIPFYFRICNVSSCIFDKTFMNINLTYDEIIINLLFETLLLNKIYFEDFEFIQKLSALFFKPNMYQDIVTLINSIDETFKISTIHNLCYNSSTMIGKLFKNVNTIMEETINNIYNIPNSIKYFQNFSLCYVKKSFDILKNIDGTCTKNIDDCFYFFQLKIYNVFNAFLNKKHLLTYINDIDNYLLTYYTYLVTYKIPSIDYNNMMNVLNHYKNIYIHFNNTFNKNIFIDTSVSTSNMDTNNVISIFILLKNFISISANNDMSDAINLSYEKFETFLINKYSQNIYTDCINSLLQLSKNITSPIKLDYFNKYITNNQKYEGNNNEYSNSLNMIAEQNKKILFLFNDTLKNLSFTQLEQMSEKTIINVRKTLYNSCLNISKTLCEKVCSQKYIYDKNISNLLLNIVKGFTCDTGMEADVGVGVGMEVGEDVKTKSYVNIFFNNGRNKLYSTNYLNVRIERTFILEKQINRFIYDHITNYVVNIQKNPFSTNIDVINFVNSHTLYDYVSLLQNNIPLSNMALYHNDPNMGIFCSTIYNDTSIPLQNSIYLKWFNNQMLNWKTLLNTFSNSMKKINHFSNLILTSNINVIDHFYQNIDEFEEYIYLWSNSSEDFSPENIFNSVINIGGTGGMGGTGGIDGMDKKNIDMTMNINRDHIIKKIVTHLFMIYTINSDIGNIINENIEDNILKNCVCKYNFNGSTISVDLNNLFSGNFYETLKEFIKEITTFSEITVTNNINPIYNNVSYIYNENNTKNFFNEFISYSILYINSYLDMINSFSITSFINEFNTMLSLDNNNDNNYQMSIATYLALDCYKNSKSTVLENESRYYSKTSVLNTTLCFILPLYLLNKICLKPFSTMITNQLNEYITNVRIGGSWTINILFENLKGYVSKYDIKNDIMFVKNDIFSRASNIEYLTNVQHKTNNLSNIIPSDYDLNTINLNMKNIYGDKINIYKKFYNYDYNYYQWKNNYKTIYLEKLNYYKKYDIETFNYILSNDKYLFKNIFEDFIKTVCACTYTKTSDNKWFIPFKKIIDMYCCHFLSFKLNIKMYQNLQMMLKNISNINDIKIFINELYFYELFTCNVDDVYDVDEGREGEDGGGEINKELSMHVLYNDFVKSIETKNNYNFVFNVNRYNWAYNLYNCLSYVGYVNIVDIENLINKASVKEVLINYIERSKNKVCKNIVKQSTINFNTFINSFSISIVEASFSDTNNTMNEDLHIIFVKSCISIIDYNEWLTLIFEYLNDTITYELCYDIIYSTCSPLEDPSNSCRDIFDACVINNYYGITFVENVKSYLNSDIKIEMLNYILTRKQNLDKNEFISKNYKLCILHKIRIYFMVCTYNYENLLVEAVTNTNTYISCDKLTYCLNICDHDVLVITDFSNNVINNRLSNYYKNIQNKTVKQIMTSSINDMENKNVNKEYLSTIFENIVTGTTIEYNINEKMFYNSSNNIYDGYNTCIKTYNKDTWITSVFKNIINGCERQNIMLDSIFGKSINNNPNISINSIVNIYSKKMYTFNNTYINCTTVLLNNYTKYIISYYIWTMISYVLTKKNRQNKQNGYFFSMDRTELIHIMINRININILEIQDESTNIFFEKLYDLINNNFDNVELVQNIISFFDWMLQYELLKIDIDDKSKSLNLKTYDGMTMINEDEWKENMEILTLNKWINNNKINVWNNMLINIIYCYKSNYTYGIKSLSKDDLINIPELFVSKCKKKTNNIFNYLGILSIVDGLKLFAGEEQIDHINNQMMLIMCELLTNLNKISGLFQMTGQTTLKDFIVKTENPYIYKINEGYLYLPIGFFSTNKMHSIPLISSLYQNYKIRMETTLSTLFNSYYGITFLTKNNLAKTWIITDYIIVERPERIELTKKQDNLIETHGIWKQSKIIDTIVDEHTFFEINFDMTINGLIKELFWTLSFYVNNCKYNIDNNLLNELILSTIFYIDGVRRDGCIPISGFFYNNNYAKKYNKITTLLNQYKYSVQANKINPYNIYSFALLPNGEQPSGAINMNMYNVLRIQLIVDKKVYERLFGCVKNVKIDIEINTVEYNLLRFQSGISGLLFSK